MRIVEPKLVFSDGLQVIFYNDSGLVSSLLKAENAEVNEDDNVMIVSDDVILTSSEGKKIETEELIWDKNKIKFILIEKLLLQLKRKLLKVRGLNQTLTFRSI